MGDVQRVKKVMGKRGINSKKTAACIVVKKKKTDVL